MDLSEHVARALHDNGPMTSNRLVDQLAGDDLAAIASIRQVGVAVRPALFNLFLHGQIQFWRKDGDWIESPTGTTREMGDVHYALAPNSAVDVNSWFMWHGGGL